MISCPECSGIIPQPDVLYPNILPICQCGWERVYPAPAKPAKPANSLDLAYHAVLGAMLVNSVVAWYDAGALWAAWMGKARS